MRLFGRGEDEDDEFENEEEEYVEVNAMDAGEKKTGQLGVKIERLNDFGDTDRVLRAMRTGSIVFLKIKDLKEKDMGELKRAIEKLKRTAMANNGDIVGVEQDWLILTPEFAAVERE